MPLHAGLEAALPPTRLGLLLLLWVKEVRRVARRAAMLREQHQKLEAGEKLVAAKGSALEGARVAQVGCNEARHVEPIVPLARGCT